MPRIRLAELEQARSDPAGYRRERLDQVRDSRFPMTYVGAIRFALLRYHRIQDRIATQRYLDDILARHNLVNASRVNEVSEQLDWYVDEYTMGRWLFVRTRVAVNVPLPSRTPPDLDCSGEVFRVDLNPSGGYAGWLLQQTVETDWRAELRLPLIQRALARDTFGVPVDEVAVGIIALKDRAMHLHSYPDAEIRNAEAELDRLLRRMGY